jgi:AraC-like DNA-binding protein
LFQERLLSLTGGDRTYRDDIPQLLAAIDAHRDRLVASGIHRIFGASLGWPEWLFEGTGIAPQRTLPRYISLADDLTILANLLDRLGPERMLVEIARRPEHNLPPGLLSVLLSAPTLEHAMRHLLELAERQLPMLNAALTKPDGNCFALSVETMMSGPVGRFYVYTLILMFANMARLHHFGPDADAGAVPVVIVGGESSWHNILEPYFPCTRFVVSHASRLDLAKDWVEAPNPYRDDLIWREGEWRLANAANRASQDELVRRLDFAFRNTLERERRILPLAEAAREEGMSQRTLSRRLTELGTSYQERLDLARSYMAEQLLRDEKRSVASIARMLGFSHSSSFARAFASWTNLSPGQWRTERAASARALPDG